MKTVSVNVTFNGTIDLVIPKGTPAALIKKLVENKALCFALATTENPDAPELEAFEEFAEEFENMEEEKLEKIWDDTKIEGVSGDWSLTDEEIED